MESTGMGHTGQEQIQRSLTFRAASMRARQPKTVFKSACGSGNELSDPAEIPKALFFIFPSPSLSATYFKLRIFLVCKKNLAGVWRMSG